MEINVHEDNKTVEIWLTKDEAVDETVRESLRPLYRRCKEAKYTATVFLSGELDLCEETGALLCRTRKRAAEREVQEEKTQGFSMSL